MRLATLQAFVDEFTKIAMSPPMPGAPRLFTGSRMGEVARNHVETIRGMGGVARARRKERQALVKYHLHRQGQRALPPYTSEAL